MSSQVTFRDNTEAVLGLLNKAELRGLDAIGMAAEGHAKEELYPGHGLDTGRLRNSITYVVSGYQTHVSDYRSGNVKGGAGKKHTRYSYGGGTIGTAKDKAVYLGTNVEHGPYAELGTRNMEGYHYLQKAATEHGDEYKGLLEDSMKNA